LTRKNANALAKALPKKNSIHYKSTKMNNLFQTLPPLPVYVSMGGSVQVEVVDVRKDNYDDTLNDSEESGGTPSVYIDQDDSLLTDDMQTIISVREVTDELLMKAHEVVLNEHPFHQIMSRVSLIARVKSPPPKIKAGGFYGPIKTFLKELIGLTLCCIKRKGHCLHRVCVKDNVELDLAV
jgi:hypothetical protein